MTAQRVFKPKGVTIWRSELTGALHATVKGRGHTGARIRSAFARQPSDVKERILGDWVRRRATLLEMSFG